MPSPHLPLMSVWVCCDKYNTFCNTLCCVSKPPMSIVACHLLSLPWAQVARILGSHLFNRRPRSVQISRKGSPINYEIQIQTKRPENSPTTSLSCHTTLCHLVKASWEVCSVSASMASSWVENPTDDNGLLLKQQMSRFRFEDNNVDFMSVQPLCYRVR